MGTGVDVTYDQSFRQFLAKKLAFFLNQILRYKFGKNYLYFEQNPTSFLKFFGENILKLENFDTIF
jgi:hypothetical protein